MHLTNYMHYDKGWDNLRANNNLPPSFEYSPTTMFVKSPDKTKS
jgi:hypothetical protein